MYYKNTISREEEKEKIKNTPAPKQSMVKGYSQERHQKTLENPIIESNYYNQQNHCYKNKLVLVLVYYTA